MIHQSILIPATPKTLTRVGLGTTFTVSPGIVMSATADSAGTGTYLLIRDGLGAITREHVNITVATFILGTTFIPVTSVAGVTKYIRAETISSYEPSLGGTQLQLLSDDTGNDQACTLVVTQSVATMTTAITTALSTVDPGVAVPVSIVATGANQGAAAAVTSTAQNVVVSITGGAAKTGIALAASTSGQKRTVINATATSKVVYPAVGGFFLDQLVNEGITINGYEAVDIYADSTGKWVREENGTIQTVTGSGTIQGGGVIQNDTETVLFTPSAGNTACTLPAAVAGKVVRIQNISSTVVGKVFPASGANINGGTVDVSINLGKSSMVVLMCNIAGAWIDVNIQQTKLVADSISPVVGGGSILLADPTAGTFVTFNIGTATFVPDVILNEVEVSAAGGGQAGATLTKGNIVNIMICAAVGDGILLNAGGSNTKFIKNFGAECCNVYCPVGTSMNGVADGFASVNRGAMAIAHKDSAGNWSCYELGGAQPGVYTAFAGGGQGSATLLRNQNCTITTCATAGDSVILNDQYTFGIVVNGTGTAADVFPPVGSTLNGALNTAVSVPATSGYIFSRNGVGSWILQVLFP